MTKLDRIALKLLPIIIILIILVWIVFSLANQVVPTQRATYHNIAKVEITYRYADDMVIIYDIERDLEKMQAIVDDINSQSYGSWRESLGGKEGASAISIHFYNHSKTPVASFSLFPSTLSERGPNYRQLGIDGFFRRINIKDLPALKAVWCDHKNTDAYNNLQLIKLC